MTDAGKRLIAEAEEAKAEFEHAGGKSLAQVKAEMMTDAPEHPPTTSAEWKPFFPPLMFADYIGPEERWFAWRPVRLWDTSVRWLCYVHRRRALPHEYLTNSGGAFWVYTKELRA